MNVAWGKTAQKLRVPAGTVLGVVFLLLMHPSRRSLMIGCTVAVLGAGIRVWAAGHIEKGRVLTRGGPYSLTRNPLYVGSFLMGLGMLLAGQGYWLLIPFGLFFGAVYLPVMKAEEGELLAGHGASFEQYCSEVPLFFPNFRRSTPGDSRFTWSRVFRNREHRNLMGFALVALILVVKSLV
jgi:protein-S-isoprenylcysteine O-methyltransferase Ste14